VNFRILGPLEVQADGRELPLGGSRQRAVLAILLLHRGESVSVDRIADELWGERPPETAAKTIHVYVSRLRKALGEGVLVTRGGGYALELAEGDVDADRFGALAREGREALERGEAAGAAESLGEALELWRGPPLSDLAYESFAQAEIGRLEELRLGVLEDRIDADLALGRHTALVPELEALVDEHRERERLRGQLMLALYRSGRQGDALESYRDMQRALDRELGLAPGPELQELERAILAQDPAIAAPQRRGAVAGLPAGRRGGVLVAVGGGLLLAAVIAAIVSASGGGSESERATPNSLAVIDPDSNDVVATVPTGVQPADVSAGAGSIWVANRGDDTATQVDPRTREVLSTISPRTGVGGLAAGGGAVWIGAGRGSELVRLDPAFGTARSIPLAPRPEEFALSAVNPVAVGHGAVWALRADFAIARVDAETNDVVAKVPVGAWPSAIATGAGGVWVADDYANTVIRIDPKGANSVTATTPVGRGPSAVAVGEGAVWVANTDDNTVARIDPDTAAVTETIQVGRRPTGIAAGGGAVWVANSLSGTVSRIDPETNQVEATLEVGEAPQGVTVAHEMVWVTVQARAVPPEEPSGASEGDVARVLVPSDPGPTDPAFYGDPQLLGATCALLYSYPARPLPENARLRPELARGQPSVSDGGTTYTVRLRSGFRFSPPSNEPVTAAAFERAIERALSPKMHSFGSFWLSDIVGAKAYAAGRSHRLAGVSARDGTLVIRLTRPVPDLPERLSTPYFCAVPPDTPIDPEGIDELPSAGPYYIASYVPNRSLVLRRNPGYGGTRPQRLAEIRYSIGIPPARGVAAVEGGRADYVELTSEDGSVPPNVERRLLATYGPRSEAARAGRQQLFTRPDPVLASFAFNTRRGPFVDVRLRRAVNYAIDRRALAEDTGFGEPGLPTDQYIPQGIPGFEDAAIYPLGGPELADARRLAGSVERDAVLYTCDTPGCTSQAAILRSNLRAIGIQLEVRQFPIDEMFDRTLRGPASEPWDLSYQGWIGEIADPLEFIDHQFASGAEHPGGFGEATFDRRIAAASRLRGDARLRAYAELDRDLVEQSAPQATFASGKVSYFLSARMGCQVLHPIYGVDVASLCLREEDDEE
jgi:YVTN family beta-propeller protein